MIKNYILFNLIFASCFICLLSPKVSAEEKPSVNALIFDVIEEKIDSCRENTKLIYYDNSFRFEAGRSNKYHHFVPIFNVADLYEDNNEEIDFPDWDFDNIIDEGDYPEIPEDEINPGSEDSEGNEYEVIEGEDED